MKHRERKGDVNKLVPRPSLTGWLPCCRRSLTTEETRCVIRIPCQSKTPKGAGVFSGGNQLAPHSCVF